MRLNAGFRIATVWGIPIRLHASWFVIFGLVTWSLASGFLPEAYPQLPSVAHWAIGALTSLLFAASVLLHELGHAWQARRDGVPVRQVTLFLFGGVAEITREPSSAGSEFRVAIAGPLVSLGLAGIFGGLYLIDRSMAILAAPSEWLARINLTLALFNLIPGFPLDGGRVLRAIVWRVTKNPRRATEVAATAGQIVAFGFIAIGIFTIFRGNLFNGLWLAFIGWFLQNAAASSLAQSTVQEALRGVKVSQVMDTSVVSVASFHSLERVVEENVLTGGENVFLVTDSIGSSIRGILTLREITLQPRPEWKNLTAADVMIPCDRLAPLNPQTELLQALRQMDEAGYPQLPVTEGGEVRGILTRDRILHYLRLRAEVGF